MWRPRGWQVLSHTHVRNIVTSRNGIRDAKSLVSWVKASEEDDDADFGLMQHVVAFSGGIDSSVVAAAVYKAHPDHSMAILGVSPSLSAAQRQQAHEIASVIGIPLIEIETTEGSKELYIENEGQACYACKTSLYKGMSWEAVVDWTSRQHTKNDVNIMVDRDSDSAPPAPPPSLFSPTRFKLYNGTNADDVTDTTRVGLRAAAEFQVCSPLLECNLSKKQVRDVGQALGLPNYNAAASPCLRSRLALGVPATPASLRQVEQAEEIVKAHLVKHRLMQDSTNIRVRHLKSGAAAVELDQDVLDAMDPSSCGNNNKHNKLLPGLDDMLASIAELGYNRVDVRPFKSGSVSFSVETA